MLNYVLTGGGLAVAAVQQLIQMKVPLLPAFVYLGSPWLDLSKTGTYGVATELQCVRSLLSARPSSLVFFYSKPYWYDGWVVPTQETRCTQMRDMTGFWAVMTVC